MAFKFEQRKINRTFWRPFENEKKRLQQIMKAYKTNL